jgi:putative intracellular protease/amidase
MGKLLVFLYEDMADFEITYATHLMGTSGAKEIVTIAYENKIVKSKCGLTYTVAKTVKEALNDVDVEGLLIPGGWNGEIREELMILINKLFDENKLLAAICAGPRFFAKAGILDKVKYTTSLENWGESQIDLFKEEKDPFPRENYVKTRVIRDKNVITSQGYAFVDFAIEICDWFKLFNNEKEKNDYLNFINNN